MEVSIFDMASDQAKQLVGAVIDLLKKERKNQSLTLTALASMGKLDVTMLSRVEKKERIPSFSFFVDWANALSLPIEEVIKAARESI